MRRLRLLPVTADIERTGAGEPFPLAGRDPGWIFDERDGEVHWLQRIAEVQPRRAGAEFRVLTSTGEVVPVRVEMFSPFIARVQMLGTGPPAGGASPMLVGRARPGHVTVTANRRHVRITSAAVTIEITRDPWHLQMLDRRGRPVFAEFADRYYGGFVTSPSGLLLDRATGRRRAYTTFRLQHDEHVYGLGERYGSLDRRGLRLVLWSVDTHGSNSTDLAYKPVPFFLSTAGYGIFIHTSARTVVDLGATSSVSGWFLVDGAALDYFIIHGPALRQILRRYLDLTGHPVVPPLWSFGVWFSRCMYRSRREVEQVVRQARRQHVPMDVIHLDPLWLAARKTRDYDSCDFRWDVEAFGPPGSLTRWLGRRGVRLSLWENPYFPMESPLFAAAAQRGYFLRAPDGSPARFGRLDAALVDFTNPEATEWYKSLHRPLLRQGVAVFKPDYGEAVPPEALAADGSSGAELHNIYPLLYNRAVFEVTGEVTDRPVVWGRSGWAGSQRYPVQWSGDPPSRWEVLPSILASGLSMAMSGFAFWSHDIGGFYGLSDPRLYVRWAQLGLLSSHARFHGKEPREPWHMGADALAVVRRYAQLRYRLLPYLYSEAVQAVRDGLPLMRPLVLEFQEDPTTAGIADQYLLGRALLVAPVLAPETRRRVYLPEGGWWDFWTGRLIRGPRWLTVVAPLEVLPLFVRTDSILPLGPVIPHTGRRMDPLTFELRLEAGAAYDLHHETGRITLRASSGAGTVTFRAGGGAGTHIVHLIGAKATTASVTGHAVVGRLRRSAAATDVILRVGGPYALTLHLPDGIASRQSALRERGTAGRRA